MKFYVNENCIGCGMCAGTCPEVFDMTEEGTAQANDIEPEGEILNQAQEAMESCPTSAIEEK